MHPNFSVSSPQSHFSTWWPDMATQMVGYLLVRGEAPLYYNQGHKLVLFMEVKWQTNISTACYILYIYCRLS